MESRGVEIEWQRHEATTALIINTPIIGRPREAKKAAAV